jgi:transketolase
MSTTTTTDLETFADQIRLRAVHMIKPHGFGYLGQALSSAELFAALFAAHYRPDRDDLVISPGHYIIAAFAAAPSIGQLDERDLTTYGRDDSILEAIGTEKSPVADLVCGSLGTGLSGAVGFALANRFAGRDDARVWALVSDGELEEGQLWEAAMFAAHNRLGNITVILDANDSQVDGPVSSVTTIEPIAQKFEAFGWAAWDVDGHDVGAVNDALAAATADPRPSVVIGRTSTIHGLSVLPPDADGHFIKLPEALADAAIAELEARLA